MKTIIIPAQITTVEDKIAGSLNFTQVILLMLPVFWGATVYIMLPAPLHLNWYKYFLIGIVTTVSLVLAIRVKDKLVFEWLKILLRFNLRPKYYVFNKNDAYLRRMDTVLIKEEKNRDIKPAPIPDTNQTERLGLSLPDFVHFESLINNKKFNLSFKPQKKGGLNVAFEQIQK